MSFPSFASCFFLLSPPQSSLATPSVNCQLTTVSCTTHVRLCVFKVKGGLEEGNVVHVSKQSFLKPRKHLSVMAAYQRFLKCSLCLFLTVFSVDIERVLCFVIFKHLAIFSLTLQSCQTNSKSLGSCLCDGGNGTAIPDLLARLCMYWGILSPRLFLRTLIVQEQCDFTVSSLIIPLTAFITVWYGTNGH